MGWFKNLFSAPSVVDAGIDLAKRGADAIDVLFYTDEEKTAGKLKYFDLFLKLEEKLAPQGAIRSITRRILAKEFCETYLFLILAAAVIYPVNSAWATYIFGLIKVLGYAVGAIILFFFGSYAVGEYLIKKDK